MTASLASYRVHAPMVEAALAAQWQPARDIHNRVGFSSMTATRQVLLLLTQAGRAEAKEETVARGGMRKLYRISPR